MYGALLREQKLLYIEGYHTSIESQIQQFNAQFSSEPKCTHYAYVFDKLKYLMMEFISEKFKLFFLSIVHYTDEISI